MVVTTNIKNVECLVVQVVVVDIITHMAALKYMVKVTLEEEELLEVIILVQAVVVLGLLVLIIQKQMVEQQLVLVVLENQVL